MLKLTNELAEMKMENGSSTLLLRLIFEEKLKYLL